MPCKMRKSSRAGLLAAPWSALNNAECKDEALLKKIEKEDKNDGNYRYRVSFNVESDNESSDNRRKA